MRCCFGLPRSPQVQLSLHPMRSLVCQLLEPRSLFRQSLLKGFFWLDAGAFDDRLIWDILHGTDPIEIAMVYLMAVLLTLSVGFSTYRDKIWLQPS
jgi:hypothetical protein